MAAALGDLILPVACGGCGCPGTPWCDRCRARMADAPVLLQPRLSVGVPVWALGRYRAPFATAVVAMKEQARRDLAAPLGAGLAHALVTLAQWGELPPDSRLSLVPAPTRTLAARRRGGDTVTAFAAAAARLLGPSVEVVPLLRTWAFSRDSMGLSARSRASNMSGAVTLRRRGGAPAGTVVLVDDVLTTGATAAESVAVLAAHGVEVHCAIVIAGA